MSDVLFRYLLKAREHDGSWYQRAFLSDERRLAAGIEKLIETAAIRLQMSSQLEHVTWETGSAPASRQALIRFRDPAEVVPPEPGLTVTRTDRFPVRASLKIRTCTGCRGTGQAACDECAGTGHARCPSCFGSGTQTTLQGLQTSCLSCGGSGSATCGTCQSTGAIQHHRCVGEGQLATWDEEVHEYSVRTRTDLFLPDGAPPGAGQLVDRWLEQHPASTTTPLAEAVPAALGALTPEVQSVIRRTEMRRASYEHAIAADPQRCLFTDVHYSIVPMSACVTRSELSATQTRSWLIGRGADALEIPPSRLLDPWKAAAWPGLTVACAGAAESWMQLHGASLVIASAVTSPVAPLVIGAVAAASAAAAAVGLRRVLLGGKERVRTVAVLSCTGESTLYLPCVAALGSLTGALEVLDRIWRSNMEALLGDKHPTACSRTVGVRTSKGELVRLIEVADPYHLAREELARMAEACHGILFLETPERSADALRARLHGSTILRPTELRLGLDPAALDADTRGRTPEGRLALHSIRRAFTRETSLAMEWPAVFADLWGPVSAFLSEKEGERPRHRFWSSAPERLATRTR